jgi:hypothetical protein
MGLKTFQDALSLCRQGESPSPLGDADHTYLGILSSIVYLQIRERLTVPSPSRWGGVP